MAAKMPELNYSCEICGVEGLNDEEMRSHMVVFHLEGAASCPFCDLCDVSAEEMLMHVNSAHLDYLTPERELLSFIDEEDDCSGEKSRFNFPAPLPSACWNNNNNNNNNINSDSEKLVVTAGCSGGAGSSGSPLRSNLALNLPKSGCSSGKKKVTSNLQQCFLCSYQTNSPNELEEHINRQHFDLTSPSFPPSFEDPVYNCPLCVQTFNNSPDLELHVNIEHKDILSPAKPKHIPNGIDTWNDSCPVCCMTNFTSNQEMVAHIEDHFNQKGTSPVTPDVTSDRLLAREIEKHEREVRRQREQHEFELLRAQYGMDNQGNFREQSLTNMQKAVYAGEMTVADYYERQIELKAAENNGVDDGSSCTKDLVQKICAASSSSPHIVNILTCSTVDHYASTYGDKGWGCGYRNMQMMLSSLLHHTGYNEQLYKPALGWNAGRSAMPSISRLQQMVEWAWSQGFDVQGCDQLGGKLFNTRKWIGATEVITVLSSHRIRCQLIDFHCPSSPDGSHPELFNWVLEYFQTKDEFKPPLYLQHQGHSRTVVGVEVHKDGSLCLLVFDPSHSPHQMSQFNNTSTALAGMRLIRKSLAAMKAKQYQLVAVCGIMDTEYEYQQSKVLRSVKVPQDR